MSDVAIRVENLGKLYRLGEIGTGTLSHDLNRAWARLRGKEDPFAKIGETNDRTTKGSSDFVWSLKDVSFEVKQGEVLGIIGRNGAGKSTLLKVLSKVTAPTAGRVKVKGRIASLLEVGTGFHPELTGRENIFLNGAILGMTKAEIRSKFDEIVDFSGVERYIDTPVKRYSSGMYVRLAFAVAAFLEPEILIVDEVLAVGDAEFQKKCLGRMKDVSVNDGRTVLFVSHNMGAVTSLCNKALVMGNGQVVFDGGVQQGVDYYLRQGNSATAGSYRNEDPKPNDILRVDLLSPALESQTNFYFNEDIILQVEVVISDPEKNYVLGFRIKDQTERNVFTSQIAIQDITDQAGTYTVQAVIPHSTLVPNRYTPILALHIPNVEVAAYLEDSVSFEIEETGTDFFQYAGNDYGCVFVDCKWSLI
ncbi:ABC transporter ATP-binding protein [Hymenobacter metallilatus]|uniref:ABC transporter ATP-binding protein n=1 Tax=Hymenobacter metallilatus TaxID=2493666 RepID=A0A428JQT3_9BACT|nr:ABC transporter ATP-binding protein [Hymenobacter metallilatus]RSK36038.1 ABC transporter ATP-binding protein [Hymenobacter metallilatus]